MNVLKISCVTAATFVTSVLIVGTAVPLHAQPPVVVQGHFDPETQRIVPYGDLNLASEPGQKRLMRRVGYAVSDLCRPEGAERSFYMLEDSRHCSKVAWDSANPQIAAAIERAASGTFAAAATLTIGAER